MYTPDQFRIEDYDELADVIVASPLASFVMTTANGLLSTPQPMFLDNSAGEHGVLYGHMAKANQQWRVSNPVESLAIFMGPDVYITPSWYATKRETGKVVPTWNYVAVHAYGVPEFFDDEVRLLAMLTKLTDLHEASRASPWAVTDAPEGFIEKQLGAIVGVRLPISRLEGKKMSQNRTSADGAGVVTGLQQSQRHNDQAVSRLIPLE